MTQFNKKFAIQGIYAKPFIHQEGTVVDKLPAAVYEVLQSMEGYFLKRVAVDVELPSKIYGSTLPRAERILSVYKSLSIPMSVGLFGLKGTGKTLLANVLAATSIAQDRPVIDVSDSFSTDPEYLKFIDSLGDVTIIFDEFLKHLSKLEKENETVNDSNVPRDVARKRQDEMLTFFQGTNNTKRLIVLIDNSQYFLSEFLQDRPGRMRYSFQYSNIEREVVEQLCKDANLDDKKTESLTVYAMRSKTSFDVINTIINEWVMYPDDTLPELIKILNVPSIVEEFRTKASVNNFKGPSDSAYILENELTEVTNSGEFELRVSRPNPFYGQPEMTLEDFNKTKFAGDYSYSYFIANRPLARLPVELTLNNNYLVGIKNGIQAYKYGDYSFEVELLDTYSYRSTTLNTYF